VELLVIGAVACRTKYVLSVQIFQHFICPRNRYGAFVQGMAEILFKSLSVKLYPKGLKNVVPPYLFKLGKGDGTLFYHAPELVIFSGKNIIHIRLV